MAGKTQRESKVATVPTPWEQFAAVSRDALLPAGKRTAKSVRKRGSPAGRSGAAVIGTQNLAQATAQALRLGRKQAEWIVAQRKEPRERRAKANNLHLSSCSRYAAAFHGRRDGDGAHACGTARG